MNVVSLKTATMIAQQVLKQTCYKACVEKFLNADVVNIYDDKDILIASLFMASLTDGSVEVRGQTTSRNIDHLHLVRDIVAQYNYGGEYGAN